MITYLAQHWLEYVIVFAVMTLIMSYRRTRKYVYYTETLVHESGHAIAAMITGGRLQGIKLNIDTSGETTTAHAEQGTAFSRFITTLSGYPASLFLVGVIVGLLSNGQHSIGWFILASCAGLSLFFARSLFTVYISIISFVLPATMIAYRSDVPASTQTAILAAICVMLVLSSWSSMKELKKVIKYRDFSDAHTLAQTTHTPLKIWWWVFLGANFASVYLGWFITTTLIGIGDVS